MVTFGQVSGGAAVALVGVDRPEPAVQRAFDHARVVHLRECVAVVALFDVEAGAAEIGRRIQMAVERDQALLQGLARASSCVLNSMAWADSGAHSATASTKDRWRNDGMGSPVLGRARP